MSDFPSASVLRQTGHRPWPIPTRPWVMTQSWHDLLFAHWPIAPGLLRVHVPPALPLDLYEGHAWLGVVPFHMTNVAPRGVPPVPFLSAFPELNVRTYVSLGGKPGVYFFSLDATSALAVAAARVAFGLPYFLSRMRVGRDGDGVRYVSRRRGTGTPAAFQAHYRPVGPGTHSVAGSLEYFLTERYCLYVADGTSRPRRLEIHHPPWLLQPAEADIAINTMAAAAGLPLTGPPLLHFSRRQDMVAWLMQPV